MKLTPTERKIILRAAEVVSESECEAFSCWTIRRVAMEDFGWDWNQGMQLRERYAEFYNKSSSYLWFSFDDHVPTERRDIRVLWLLWFAEVRR